MPLIDLISLTGQYVNVKVEIVSQDATGGPTQTFETITDTPSPYPWTKVPCMIRAPSAATVAAYAQKEIVITNHILFSFNLDDYITDGLSTQHQLVDVVTGATYSVKGSGIFNPLVLSGEQVYRCDVEVRRAPT